MTPDELGAHVSSAAGVEHAPARAQAIAAAHFQLFTKQPSRWAEPRWDEQVTDRFEAARREADIRSATAHDSYLINLASPDRVLNARSRKAFRAELERCAALGLDFLVTHPGSATDGDRASGIARNADGVTLALESVDCATLVLFEITAGSGNVLGCSFGELASLIALVPEEQRARVGICFDTCHAYAAGYDLAGDWGGVWARFDDEIGLDRVRLFHVNDSKTPFASRRDRHENIGDGSLGLAPFASLMTDPRFVGVPKLLETPKGDDPVAADRENLRRLRALRTSGTEMAMS